LLLAGVTRLPAARIQRLSIEELALKSSTVFVGVVDGIGSHDSWNGATTWTDYQIRILEILSGSVDGGVLTASFADGGPEGAGGGLAGLPRLEIAKEYLFFWDGRPNLPVPTVGWNQGIFFEAVDDALGSGTRVLVSMDGEPLWIDERDRLQRGAPVRVDGDRIAGMMPNLRDKSLQLSEPTPIGGSIGAQPPAPEVQEIAPEPVLVRPATLADLKALISELRAR